MYLKTYYYYIKTINRNIEVNPKKNPLTPVGKGSCNVATLAGPFKGGALAPVPRTGTKGWAFSPGRAAPAREPGQQALPDRC